MDCIRSCIRVKRTLARLFYGEGYRYSYIRHAEGSTPICWEADVPAGMMIVETIHRDCVDTRETRKKVWYAGEHFVQTHAFPLLFSKRARVPWLWLGGVTCAGETHSCTDDLLPFLVVGNTIRMDLLRTLHPDILYWRYLDPTTFEEREFPAEGMVIEEDDSDEPNYS